MGMDGARSASRWCPGTGCSSTSRCVPPQGRRLEDEGHGHGGRREGRRGRVPRHGGGQGQGRRAAPRPTPSEQERSDTMAKVHPTAIVHPGARLHETVEVGPYAVIGPKVTIGAGTHSRARTRSSKGAPRSVSATGSSSSPRWARRRRTSSTRARTPQLVIGDDNLIREFATLHIGTAGRRRGHADRQQATSSWPTATWPTTASVGNGCILANSVALAGHVEVGDFVILGGLSAVHQFTRIGQARLHRRRRDGGDGRAAVLHRAGRPGRAGGPQHGGPAARTASPRSRSAASRRPTRSSSASKLGLNEALAQLRAEHRRPPGDRRAAGLRRRAASAASPAEAR